MLANEHIGTEHILLGLIHEGEGVAAKALAASGVTLERLRTAVVATSGKGQGSPGGHIPFTPRAKKALELSLRESLELGHNYIGTEHILLGILREGEGVAVQVLRDQQVDPLQLRAKVLERARGHPQPVSSDPLPEPPQPTCPGCRISLEGRMGAKALAATSDDGDGVVALTIVYCRGCGRSLGAFPGATPVI